MYQLSDYDYELPDNLIAKYPTEKRSDSRLLCVSRASQAIQHHRFHSLRTLLMPGDLLVVNNSKVFPARLFGTKASGGKVEILIERMMSPCEFLAHVRASKTLKPDSTLHIANDIIKVIAKVGDVYHLKLITGDNILTLCDNQGHIPLPPYFQRDAEAADHERYQTVYARDVGSVAAPTAGLHFDDVLLQTLKVQGVNIAEVTLHVGAGTFQPVRTENILEHKMHGELFSVSDDTAELINRTKANGKRVIAVGTTSVRVLETAARRANKQLLTGMVGETDLFITPGFKFEIVDGLITNFHLPKSSLLMLVSAFMGHDLLFDVYRQAIAEGYRFYSYGDAMFIR